MKAFLLIAGLGTRLRPVTDDIPKCLVPIKGRPLLGIWLELLKKYNISDVLLNLHYMPEKVEDFLDKNDFGLRIIRFHEPKLLGSAGTVAANRDFVKNEDSFFIIYGDNLTNMNLTKMHRFHENHPGIFTMGLFRTNKPNMCGIAELTGNGLIKSFIEKPAQPLSNLANAGIYLANNDVFDYIKPHKTDFGFDVIPRLLGKMYGYPIEEYYLDVGSIDNYRRANMQWAGLIWKS